MSKFTYSLHVSVDSRPEAGTTRWEGRAIGIWGKGDKEGKLQIRYGATGPEAELKAVAAVLEERAASCRVAAANCRVNTK